MECSVYITGDGPIWQCWQLLPALFSSGDLARVTIVLLVLGRTEKGGVKSKHEKLCVLFVRVVLMRAVMTSERDVKTPPLGKSERLVRDTKEGK